MDGLRIVSLLPSATEIVGALGLVHALVAVSHECDHPPGVDRLPRATASRLGPDLVTPREIDEAVRRAVRAGEPLYGVRTSVIAAQRPSLILTQGLCEVCAVSGATVGASLACADMAPLADVPVAALSGGDFDGIMADIELVAGLAGVEARGEAVVAELRARWEALAELTEVEPAPQVLVLEWTDPPFSGGHWIPEMISQAGGQPVLGTRGEPSRTLEWSEVERADPDLVVVAGCGFGLSENERQARRLLERVETRRLRSVQARRLWAVDANAHFSRPGPRVVEGAEILARILRGGSLDPMREARRI